MSTRAAVILAAGKGTRMKSALPKVLHEIGGRAMIDWSIALAEAADCAPIIVVVSPSQTELTAHVDARLGPGSIAVQSEPLGTAHAVSAAREALAGHSGSTAVLYADTPLIRPQTIDALLNKVETSDAIGVLGFEAVKPGAYGRLILGASGGLERIVEAKDASPEELAVTLCNSGVLAAPTRRLFDLLSQVKNENAKGEYYLTDVVALGAKAGVSAQVEYCSEDDVRGVNSRVELAAAEAAFQKRRRLDVMESGVTLRDPDTVYFAYDTVIEADVEIDQSVVFGAGVILRSGARIHAFSHLEGAEVKSSASIGPFARLRPGSEIGEDAKIGNFVEVKKTRIGRGAKASHLSYLGDGEIGEEANIGAGTIFCNYDGYFKYKTTIGAGVFVGSNSALVAPVTLADGAYIGSGSVITKDVGADALALSRAEQVEKPGWAAAFRSKMEEKKS